MGCAGQCSGAELRCVALWGRAALSSALRQSNAPRQGCTEQRSGAGLHRAALRRRAALRSASGARCTGLSSVSRQGNPFINGVELLLQLDLFSAARLPGDDPELQSFLNPDDYFADSFCYSLLCDDLTYHANGLPLDWIISQLNPTPTFSFAAPTTTIPGALVPLPKATSSTITPAEFVLPPLLPQFPAADFSTGSCESAKNETSLSRRACSRQRRRKITVKTQELGKLVPGGQRMNTAEMLQSAYNYIKFLQAQVALLEFLGSHHQEVPFEGEEELQNLLESPLIQEKLYSTQHCLLPNKLAEQVPLLKSNPHLLEKDH
uniref:Basic helix-loop-helix transcription factor n=1 Tax=Salvia miltiorrhiza TaxID=226208 RepID=A0A0H3YB17_SALMI|nr:basic helix-loop-helix transcription factor [Salvia miltiorrhiza]